MTLQSIVQLPSIVSSQRGSVRFYYLCLSHASQQEGLFNPNKCIHSLSHHSRMVRRTWKDKMPEATSKQPIFLFSFVEVGSRIITG